MGTWSNNQVACQVLVPAAQGLFAGTDVFRFQENRLVGRPFGSQIKKAVYL